MTCHIRIIREPTELNWHDTANSGTCRYFGHGHRHTSELERLSRRRRPRYHLRRCRLNTYTALVHATSSPPPRVCKERLLSPLRSSSTYPMHLLAALFIYMAAARHRLPATTYISRTRCSSTRSHTAPTSRSPSGYHMKRPAGFFIVAAAVDLEYR